MNLNPFYGMTQEKKQQVCNAFLISFICIFTYLVSYFMRNMLSYFTPAMTDTGLFTKDSIAFISSVYMITYAAGQLVNGILGDIVKSKYMVLIGLSLAGTGMLLFGLVEPYGVRLVCFGVLGFGLSMLRGPLVKVISENTAPAYARTACVFLSFVSFLGPFIASLFAILFAWNTAFVAAGIVSYTMAVASFCALTLLEKKGLIRSLQNKPNEKKKIDILGVFKIDRFIPFLFIGMVVETVASSVSFWIPDYIAKNLLFSNETATLLASIMSFIRSFSPFIGLFLFGVFKGNDTLMIRIFFSGSTVCFILMLFVTNPWVNIIIFLIALICSAISSSTLWSIYIPSLGKSGKVSSANGVMDCTGYIAAAIFQSFSGTIFSLSGWTGTIISWCCVTAFGVLVSFFAGKKPASENASSAA